MDYQKDIISQNVADSIIEQIEKIFAQCQEPTAETEIKLPGIIEGVKALIAHGECLHKTGVINATNHKSVKTVGELTLDILGRK